MPTHSHGDLAHFDIAGDDAQTLGQFYADLFGWDVASRGPGYSSITTPDTSANGAIVEAETPSLTIGVTVENLEDTLSRTVAAGGKIVMPATDNGWVTKAQIADCAGNIVTLIQM